MTPLESAIATLREDIDSYGQGTPTQPKEGSREWFLLRAEVLGMAFLKRLQSLSLERDPAAAERLYRLGNEHFKAASPPPPPSFEREKLPDGSFPNSTFPAGGNNAP